MIWIEHILAGFGALMLIAFILMFVFYGYARGGNPYDGF